MKDFLLIYCGITCFSCTYISVQVVISSELPVLPVFPAHEEDEKPAPGPWLDCDLVNYMLQSFLPLLNTEEEKHHLLDEVLTTVEKEEDKEVWQQTDTSAC